MIKPQGYENVIHRKTIYQSCFHCLIKVCRYLHVPSEFVSVCSLHIFIEIFIRLSSYLSSGDPAKLEYSV